MITFKDLKRQHKKVLLELNKVYENIEFRTFQDMLEKYVRQYSDFRKIKAIELMQLISWQPKFKFMDSDVLINFISTEFYKIDEFDCEMDAQWGITKKLRKETDIIAKQYDDFISKRNKNDNTY